MGAANEQYCAYFVPWYTYDASGKPQWYLFQGDASGANMNVISAPVCRYHGPAWGVFPYDNSQTEDGSTYTATGSATLTFTDQTHAVFQYSNVDGASRTVNLVKIQ